MVGQSSVEDYPLMEQWVIRSIFLGGPFQLFLIPAVIHNRLKQTNIVKDHMNFFFLNVNIIAF